MGVRKAQARLLELLQEGPRVWNRWRGSHPRAVPDLSDPQLWPYRLRQADFSEADLRDAIVEGRQLATAIVDSTTQLPTVYDPVGPAPQ